MSRSAISRHARRARARWRLHRMEWAALHTPLEPPAGYEKYYELKNIFPGLEVSVDFQSWADFKSKMSAAWRLYMLQYRADPEMERFMAAVKSREQDEFDEKMKEAFKYGEEAVQRGRDNLEVMGKHVKEGADEAKPFLQSRVTVLKNSVEEFAAGFAETISGEKNVWGATPPIETEEAVIIYRVKGDKSGEDDGVPRR